MEKSTRNQTIMNIDKSKVIVIIEQMVELYSTDFVFFDTSGNFVRFSDGQIMVSADENEVQEEIGLGSVPVRCTDLSKDKQIELIEDINKTKNYGNMGKIQK